MFQKRTNTFLMLLLALALVFGFSSCEKLKISRLKANYHFSKANKFFSDNLYRKAMAEYEVALQYDPNLTQAYRFLGESYKQLYKPGLDSKENIEKADKALAALNKALEIEPNNKEIIFSMGDMYDKMRDFNNGEKMYLKILELEPQNMNNYYVVAEFYKKYAGENAAIAKKAESMYLRRIEADPENPQGYAYMANYYDSLTPIPDFDKGMEYNKMRAQLEPNNAEIYYALGVNRFFKAYRLQNMLSAAEREELGRESEKALLKAIELDPNYPWPYSYMKLVYLNIFAKLYPEEDRYTAEADRWGEKFLDVQKRDMERKRLEKELKKTG